VCFKVAKEGCWSWGRRRRTLERLDVAAGQGDADLVDLGALAEVLLRLVYNTDKSALKFPSSHIAIGSV
jgi:hypothetical protein